MTWPWAWSTASPRERADWVRLHVARRWVGSPADLCDLFQLTEAGALAIILGDTWRPEHSIEPESGAAAEPESGAAA